MRAVLSISIPPHKLAKLKKRAELENMTVSAYVIGMVDAEENMIREEELLSDIANNHQEIKRGNYRMMGPSDSIEDFLPLDE
jgi:hypothetical protein